MLFRITVFKIGPLRKKNQIDREEGEGWKGPRDAASIPVRCVGRRRVRASDGNRAAGLAWIALVSQPLVRSRLSWKRSRLDYWMQKHCNVNSVAAQVRPTSLLGPGGDLLLENEEGAWVLQVEKISEEPDHTDRKRYTKFDFYLWLGQFSPDDPTDLFRTLRRPERN